VLVSLEDAGSIVNEASRLRYGEQLFETHGVVEPAICGLARLGAQRTAIVFLPSRA
jgi:hypothetical protein